MTDMIIEIKRKIILYKNSDQYGNLIDKHLIEEELKNANLFSDDDILNILETRFEQNDLDDLVNLNIIVPDVRMLLNNIFLKTKIKNDCERWSQRIKRSDNDK